VILSIGAFAIIDDSIHIKDSFEVVLLQYKFLHDNHLSNEFIIESKLPKLGESSNKSLYRLFRKCSNSGHHVDFDVDMINATLDRLIADV
jgi:DNA polymerase-3 subunit epsilon